MQLQPALNYKDMSLTALTSIALLQGLLRHKTEAEGTTIRCFPFMLLTPNLALMAHSLGRIRLTSFLCLNISARAQWC